MCVCVCVCPLWNHQPEHPQFLTMKTTNLTASEPCFWRGKRGKLSILTLAFPLCFESFHSILFGTTSLSVCCMFKPSLSIRSFPLAFEIAQVFPIREKMTWSSFFLYPLFLLSYISNILKERSKFIVPPFSPHLNPWHTLVWCPISALFVYAYKLFFNWKNRRNNKEKHNKYPHNQQLLLSHFSRIWLCATP